MRAGVGVVPVLAVLDNATRYFIVMERADGGALLSCLADRTDCHGSLEAGLCCRKNGYALRFVLLC